MNPRGSIVAAGYDWIVPEWQAPDGVMAFVTTRRGGASSGPSASLDLGPARLEKLDPASRSLVLQNRARVAALLPSEPVWLEQTHGTAVAVVTDATLRASREMAPVADAAVTRLVDVPLAVRVADCLPVFFADDRPSVVAVAHAGWRGLAAGVLEATLEAMRVDASSVVAWLGPAIGPHVFEVGVDVLEAFGARDSASKRHFVARGTDKWLADLRGLARQRLAAAGVARVDSCGHCTYTDEARFYSYRRDRSSGRLGAFIWRASPSGL